MYWFKSCPRCHGDLFTGSDIHGSYIACLQCSHELTMTEEIGLRRPQAKVAMQGVAVAQRDKAAA
ncbi:MAG: hypothetical protein IH955_01105 [Chloroflexi bacterium]|nr:hypothetical protein [Chloroflexota bacterium]